ncbi:MAG: nucleotidyltransferase domain-containing protein [Nitrospirae bacterium]|nr:nucleotidyltransferase domain-containing protein [Nitrospirota bacterium]
MNEEDIQKIEGCLKKYHVVTAYIFGSEAKGVAGVLSDIDVAVFIHTDIKKADRFDLRLRLSNDVSAIMGKRVDLVVLNESPIQLSYEIIRHGKLLFCSDRPAKVDMELDILSRYLDRRYYDKRHAEVVLQKMSSGGFARK